MQNQNVRVLSHLIAHGYITPVIAQNYGIRRLAARVLELKKEGVDIKTVMRTDDAGSRYAEYTMTAEDRSFEGARLSDGYGWKSGTQRQAA